ncbi:MAG: CDP-glucose 4,6-dehydratase, partial [Synergistaceae bacterium]|nr:CDP-glucose 4,6-dehydratase [Synergistaceae bacterium]
GYSLPPDEYSLRPKVSFSENFSENFGDTRDAAALEKTVKSSEPEIIFHLAAQAIVKTAWQYPAETFSANVMGTVNLLEILRLFPNFKALIAVTSDKVYENAETMRPYDEADRLGGDEPYAASKAAAELAVAAYRNAYFKTGPGVATARASNVYGGGDLHCDRLIPDLIKAKISGEKAEIRNPDSVRPWQYVLDLLGGYMKLAEKLFQGGAEFSGCWNFGPPEEELYRVGDISAMLTGGGVSRKAGAKNFHEAGLLLLNSEKSRSRLYWRPKMTLESGLAASVDFYRGMSGGADVTELMERAISSYMK